MPMSLQEDVWEKYQLAGKIAGDIRKDMEKFVAEGMPIIDICERAEKLIIDRGGRPAFPCNVSVNEIAAHYTSPPNDASRIPNHSMVKVDIGVHVEGYIGDTATTVCFNSEGSHLMNAAEEALRVAIKTIRAGISTSKLGSTIETTIKNLGYKPVSNLTGHQIGRYLVHTGKSLPNVSHLIGSKIREGEIVAIEPFVTTPEAIGKVKEGRKATIFRFLKRKTVKDANANHLLNHIEVNFRTLPFSERWLNGVVPPECHESAFNLLLSSKCILPYHVFIEASGRPVAQAEHTVLVLENGCEVLT